MAVVNTRKSGFREIGGMTTGSGGKWTKSAPDADGKTIWVSTDDAATAVIVWGPSDTQTHGEAGKPMKTGSRIVEWIDSGGVRHAEIERIE